MSLHQGRIVPAESALLSLVVLIVLTSCNHPAARPARDDPRALAEFAAAGACFSWSDSEKNFEEIEKRLDGLANNQSKATDQALVMLTGYYLGEHNGEQLFLEIIHRGNRMKTLLQNQEEHPAALNTCAPSLEAESMRAIIRDILGQIDKGVTVGVKQGR